MTWEVQTWAMVEGWHNCWTVDGKPQTFELYEEAVAELEEHIRESEEAFADGDRDDVYDIDEFRIEEVRP